MDACFWRKDTLIDGATFLVPSKLPEASLQCYSVVFDEMTGVHHVVLRKASLRHTLKLTYLSKPDYSSHIVEFSNGEITILSRTNCARGNVRQSQYSKIQHDNDAENVETTFNQVADQEPCLVGPLVSIPHKVIASGKNPTPTEISSSVNESAHTIADFTESIDHLLPRLEMAFTSTGGEDIGAAVQSEEPIEAQSEEPLEIAHDLPACDSSSTSRRSSAKRQGNSTSTALTTPASSTFSTLPFCKSTLANLPKVPIAPGKPTSVFEALALETPKKDEPKKVFARHFLGDLRISSQQFNNYDEIPACLEDMSTSRDDLAMTEEGQIVLAQDASSNAEAFEGASHDAAANQSSRVLDETRNLPESSVSPNIDEMIEDLFGHEEGFSSTTPVSNILPPPTANVPPTAQGVVVAGDLQGTAASMPMRLNLISVKAIIAINAEFFRLWNEGVSGRCWIPGQDEDEVQNLATANVAPLYNDLPDDITFIVKDFNQKVGELWEQGLPPRSLKQGTTDQDVIHELAARNLEWEYLRSNLKTKLDMSTASEPTLQLRKTFEAAPSSFDWYLQAIGGDDQYRGHRSVKVAGVDESIQSEDGSRGDSRFHHLNFNWDPVNERSYTPAEVSFWAASATINKVLIPCAENCEVHRVKVLTSQAFKRVDPVIYTGTDIEAVRGLTGSAMRNAVTSDVEVAYEAFGTWNQDQYTLDDVEPRVVSAEDGDDYEHCESGLYNYLQRPHYINDQHDEHTLCNVNDLQCSNPSMGRVKFGYQQRFSKLGPSKGVKSPANRVRMDYSGKCSSWDPPAQVTTTIPEAITDGVDGSSLSAGKAPELDGLQTHVHTDDAGEAAEDDEGVASEAETEGEYEADDEREPVHHQSTHSITEGAAEAESAESASEEAMSSGFDMSDDDSQDDSVASEEVDSDQEPFTLADTPTGPATPESPAVEGPVDQLEELRPSLNSMSLTEYNFDEYVAAVLGLAETQELMSEGIIPRTTSSRMTLLGSGSTSLSGKTRIPAPIRKQGRSREASFDSRNTSSSSEATSSDNWSSHTRNSSFSEPQTLEKE